MPLASDSSSLDPSAYDALLASIVESSDDAIISKTLQGIITSWNRAAERIFGYKANEMIGQSVTRLIPPELQAEEPNILARISRGERIDHYETLRQRKDGTLIHVALTISPMRTSDGRIVGASKIARDISPQFEAERTSRLLAAVVESSSDAIVTKSLDGTITSWNRAAENLFGYPADEAIGKSITMIIPPDRSGEEAEIIKRIQRGERVEHFETLRRTKDGRLIPLSLTVSPIKDRDGFVVGASKIARDISEQKRAESEIWKLNASLEQRVRERTSELTTVNRELEAFTYSVAHDLRAPLRGIHGYLEALVEEHGRSLPKDAVELVTRSRNSARRMSRLIEDLLNLSRVGRQDIAPANVSLDDIVKQVLFELRQETQGRNIEWRVSKLPVAFCDPGLIAQVFSNLISNAIKYTRQREKAVIEIASVYARGETAILVRDNGAGFNMEHAGKLFEPFHRMHGQADYEGTGVGLAIVDRIVRKHGGEVWTDAEENKGATFYFTLRGSQLKQAVGS